MLPPVSLLGYISTSRYEAPHAYLYDARHRITLPLVRGNPLTDARWLPTGDGLLLLAQDNGWLTLELSGTRRRPTIIEHTGTAYLPSPDWTQHLNVRTGRLLLYDVQRDSYRTLASGDELALREIVWSPDASRLAVSIHAEGAADELRHVALINVHSGVMATVTASPALYLAMRWSPDSERLALVQSPSDILVVDAASGATRLVARPSQPVEDLSWSPDGEWLTYATRDGRLFCLNTRTHTRRHLWDGLGVNTDLAWSPNGRWLLASTGTLTVHRLYLVNIQTGDARPIAANVPANGFHAWQP